MTDNDCNHEDTYGSMVLDGLCIDCGASFTWTATVKVRVRRLILARLFRSDRLMRSAVAVTYSWTPR